MCCYTPEDRERAELMFELLKRRQTQTSA